MSRFLDLCTPGQYLASLTEVDLDRLRGEGIDAILLDLDNTMLPWRSREVPGSTRDWVERARSLGMDLCIVSNTHNPKRLRRIADDLGISCIHRALKPRGWGFRRALEALGSDCEHSVVIGDQVLTDILGGNLAGIRTILVKPVSGCEFIGTKLSRLVERVVLGILSRRGKLGTNSRAGQSDKQDTR